MAARSKKNVEQPAEVVHKVQRKVAKMWLQNEEYRLADPFTPSPPHNPQKYKKCMDQISLICNACLTGLLFFFLIDFIFQSSLRFRAKQRERYRDFPFSLCHHTHTGSPVINIMTILHQSGAFVKSGKPTFTHYHSKSSVYVSIHSCCCISMCCTND